MTKAAAKAGSVAALRRNDAASVIGRYARTTLVWKAQARALIKVRTHARMPPMT